MYSFFKNGFIINSNSELNQFVTSILVIAENYLKFLVLRNRLYIPVHLEPRDIAIDLTAELFLLEKKTLIKFKDFFDNNIDPYEICCEEDLERYIRGFVYTVIQNNLPGFYKENDPVTYNIIRNVKEAVRSLGFHVSTHFSDKYIHPELKCNFKLCVAEREDLIRIIYSNNLIQKILNIRDFIRSLFELLDKSEEYPPVLRQSDLVSVIRSLITQEYMSSNGAPTASELLNESLNVKFVLDDAKFSFKEKLDKYISKNSHLEGTKRFPKNFTESMYSIIGEIIRDMNSGHQRRSVFKLMETHFNDTDKNLFYKVQYCIELFEGEIAEHIQKEKALIG